MKDVQRRREAQTFRLMMDRSVLHLRDVGVRP